MFVFLPFMKMQSGNEDEMMDIREITGVPHTVSSHRALRARYS